MHNVLEPLEELQLLVRLTGDVELDLLVEIDVQDVIVEEVVIVGDVEVEVLDLLRLLRVGGDGVSTILELSVLIVRREVEIDHGVALEVILQFGVVLEHLGIVIRNVVHKLGVARAIGLILIFERPFSGATRLSPEPFRQVAELDRG
mgnify:CR=1 FL=1